MGSSSERNQLLQLFNSHKKDIYEAFEVYEKPSDPSLVKLSWDKVLEMGDAISRQATIVGMIWTGEPPVYEEVEENMGAYVNTLNGFLLIAYGASIGAGPTLLNSIRSSVKKVLDTSFSIMKESIASFGACSENDRTIPQLTGQVWEACSELERTPSTNIVAIGRRITKVAVSVKDVLRELNDLKAGPAKEDTNADSESDSDGGADLGTDLSPEEMRVAQEAISTVSGIMSLIKELLRAITAQKSRGDEPGFVASLEKILTECRALEPTVDELGACLYPPQETEAIRAALDNISLALGNVEAELESLAGASEGFRRTWGELKGSISRFKAEVDRSEEELQGVELK